MNGLFTYVFVGASFQRERTCISSKRVLNDRFLISLPFQGFTETDYLETYKSDPSMIYSNSAIDPAMKNAFTQTRKWMMAKYSLTEYEAWTIITQAVNFGLTQLVDGNWGIHAVIPKAIFEGVERNLDCGTTQPDEPDDSSESGAGGFGAGMFFSFVASAAVFVGMEIFL